MKVQRLKFKVQIFFSMIPSLEGWPTAGVGILVAAFFILHSAFPACAVLQIENAGVTNITRTNAWVRCDLISTNGTNPVLNLFYDRVDSGTNFASWGYSNCFGTASGTGVFSLAVSNLTPASIYYYHWRADEPSTSAWPSASSNWVTTAGGPTNDLEGSNGVFLVVSSNGNVLAPTLAKFLAANALATTNASTNYVSASQILAISSRVDLAEGNITTNAANALNLSNRVAIAEGNITTNAANALNLSNRVGIAEGNITTNSGNINIVSNQAAAHATNNANPHAVTAGQIGAATTAELAGVQGNINIVSNQAAAHATNNTNPHAVTAAQIGAVPTNDGLYQTISLSMTNYVHIPASSNWLAYDPVTRLFSGCVTNQGGAGTITNLSGWSGENATTQITWVATIITTNPIVTGNGTPASDTNSPNGTYSFVGDYNGQPHYQVLNNGYTWDLQYETTIHDDPVFSNLWTIQGTVGVEWAVWGNNVTGTVITGTYSPVHIECQGNPVITVSITTNNYTWKAGYNVAASAWQVEKDGVVQIDATNVYRKDWGASLSGQVAALNISSQALNTAVAGLVGRTGTWEKAGTDAVTATNDTAGLKLSTNFLNTVANAAVKRTGDIMTGPLTNGFGFFGDGSGLTNLPSSGNGFPLITNGNASGHTISNGFFVGDGSGLTNLIATYEKLPIGFGAEWYCTNPPPGWLLQDGSSLSTGTYAALYAVIGTNYGSTNAAWFNLPDKRGIFSKGAGTTTRTAGKDATTNAYTADLGTYYQDKFQGHWHPLQDFNGTELGLNSGGSVNIPFAAYNAPVTNAFRLYGRNVVSDNINGTSRSGASTEPQSLGVNFIIKYADVMATTATNMVPLDGSVPMTGVLIAPGLQITGGSPTNTAILSSTNSTGQSAWIVYPKIWAAQSANQLIPATTWTNCEFGTIRYQRGGTWNGNTWEPQMIGWGKITIHINLYGGPGSAFVALLKNNILWLYSEKQYGETDLCGVDKEFTFFNDASTNLFSFQLYSYFSTTTSGNTAFTWMTGEVVP